MPPCLRQECKVLSNAVTAQKALLPSTLQTGMSAASGAHAHDKPAQAMHAGGCTSMPGAADEQRELAAGLKNVAQPVLDLVHDFEKGRVHVAYSWWRTIHQARGPNWLAERAQMSPHAMPPSACFRAPTQHS